MALACRYLEHGRVGPLRRAATPGARRVLANRKRCPYRGSALAEEKAPGAVPCRTPPPSGRPPSACACPRRRRQFLAVRPPNRPAASLLSTLAIAARKEGLHTPVSTCCQSIATRPTARWPSGSRRLHVSAQGYLEWILFRDGSGSPECAGDLTFAVATPHGRVVFVCGRRFERLWRKSAATAHAVIPQEVLHTLRLGQHPASGEALTSRILSRWGGDPYRGSPRAPADR